MTKRRYTRKERRALEVQAWSTLATIARRMDAVGSTPEARLVWLGDFIRRDVSSDESRAVLAGELQGLLTWQLPGGTLNPAADAGISVHVEPSAVSLIQQAVRDILNSLQPSMPVWFPQPVHDGLIWSGNRIVLVTRAQGVPQVLGAVAEILTAVGSRLRRCETPLCERLFAAKRPNQTYCTKKCGGTWRVSEWRSMNRERLADARHEQYKRKVRERLPRAKVVRRRATVKEQSRG